jgi:predicted dehydrogenase
VRDKDFESVVLIILLGQKRVSAVFVRAHDVAVLGGGVQGVRLAQRLVDSRLFKVAALFDPDRKAATGLSQLVGGVVANSAEEACQANNVLAVLVASPPRAHEEGATIASKCGKLALVEKPLAHSPESAARICKLFEHSALSACTNFWYGSARAGRVITERARALGALKYTRLHARFESWPRPWQANAGEWLSDTARG